MIFLSRGHYMTPTQTMRYYLLFSGNPSKLPTSLSSLIPSNTWIPPNREKKNTGPIHHAQHELSVSPVKVAAVKVVSFSWDFLGSSSHEAKVRHLFGPKTRGSLTKSHESSWLFSKRMESLGFSHNPHITG